MGISLKPLDQQVIVITGASSGIGLATAESAAQNGAKLVLAARNGETLADIVRQMTEAGIEATYVEADVSDRQQVERIAQAAIERFGRIDTWVNDAGLSIYGKLEEVSDEESRRLFDVNFWGVVYGSLVALPYLKANGGALINLGSEVSDAVVPLQGMYSASKHAVQGFTDALRVELQVEKAPVSVTLIQPTAVDTPFPQHARNYMEQEPKLPDPMIDPYDVANAILSAATEERRDIKVGAGSKLNTTIAKFIPKLGDKMTAQQVNRQQYDEAPRDPAGTLFVAGGEGHVYGSGPREG